MISRNAFHRMISGDTIDNISRSFRLKLAIVSIRCFSFFSNSIELEKSSLKSSFRSFLGLAILFLCSQEESIIVKTTTESNKNRNTEKNWRLPQPIRVFHQSLVFPDKTN